MIRMENVGRTLGGTLFIKDTWLSVGPGEAVCLCGPSGIGKTTLLEMAAGLALPDTGRVRRGSDRIGCMFQDDALVPWLSALDNLLLVLNGSKNESRLTARRWLDRFDLPQDQRPTVMSGGMRRRLALARAFAVEPEILLLDEPFAFLDDHWQAVVAELTESCRAAGCAVLLVSHQERRLEDICCRKLSVLQRPIVIAPAI